MALTPEQQAEIEFQEVRDAGRRAHELATIEAQKVAQLATVQATTQAQIESQAKQIRLEAIRLAKETLIENARSKPVDARDVSPADIQAFADSLTSYVNR